jgi:hypothetical protein
MPAARASGRNNDAMVVRRTRERVWGMCLSWCY